MLSIGDLADLGIAWPDHVAYENHINDVLKHTNLALPDVLIMIIAEYGSSVIITLTDTNRNASRRRISFNIDEIIISPALPNRFQCFADIQILATVLTHANGYYDLLSDRNWYKRYKYKTQIPFTALSQYSQYPYATSANFNSWCGVMHYPNAYSPTCEFVPSTF